MGMFINFLKTGALGPVACYTSRAKVLGSLGEPEGRSSNDLSWKYGRVQLFFSGTDDVSSVVTTAVYTGGSKEGMPSELGDPADLPDGSLTMDGLRELLAANKIEASPYQPDPRCIAVASGVVVEFFDDGMIFRAVRAVPDYQALRRQQLGLWLSGESMGQLRALSQARSVAMSTIAAELLTERLQELSGSPGPADPADVAAEGLTIEELSQQCAWDAVWREANRRVTPEE